MLLKVFLLYLKRVLRDSVRKKGEFCCGVKTALSTSCSYTTVLKQLTTNTAAALSARPQVTKIVTANDSRCVSTLFGCWGEGAMAQPNPDSTYTILRYTGGEWNPRP